MSEELEKDILFWEFLRIDNEFYASRLYNDERKKYWDAGYAAAMAAQVLAEEVRKLRKNAVAIELLKNLATALDGAFISSWQCTDAWQKHLDNALDFIKNDT